MPDTHNTTTARPAGTAASPNDNWQRWWSGLEGIPGEVLWEADPNELSIDLALFGAAFAATLPVVDFGCGDGHQMRLLAAHFPTVVGIDVAPAAIARARAAPEPANVAYRVMDARRPDAARELHDALGDVDVYIRGVLQALPAADRPRAVHRSRRCSARPARCSSRSSPPTSNATSPRSSTSTARPPGVREGQLKLLCNKRDDAQPCPVAADWHARMIGVSARAGAATGVYRVRARPLRRGWLSWSSRGSA